MLLSLCLPCSSQYKSAFACIRACECMNTNSLEYRVILCLHYQQVQKTGSRLFQFDFRRRIQPQLRTLHSHFQWKASYAHCSCPLTLQLSKIVTLSLTFQKNFPLSVGTNTAHNAIQFQTNPNRLCIHKALRRLRFNLIFQS